MKSAWSFFAYIAYIKKKYFTRGKLMIIYNNNIIKIIGEKRMKRVWY